MLDKPIINPYRSGGSSHNTETAKCPFHITPRCIILIGLAILSSLSYIYHVTHHSVIHDTSNLRGKVDRRRYTIPKVESISENILEVGDVREAMEVVKQKAEEKLKARLIVSMEPTVRPTYSPTVRPTVKPTVKPTYTPTVLPTLSPTMHPTILPTIVPSVPPTAPPTIAPSILSSTEDKNQVVATDDKQLKLQSGKSSGSSPPATKPPIDKKKLNANPFVIDIEQKKSDAIIEAALEKELKVSKSDLVEAPHPEGADVVVHHSPFDHPSPEDAKIVPLAPPPDSNAVLPDLAVPEIPVKAGKLTPQLAQKAVDLHAKALQDSHDALHELANAPELHHDFAHNHANKDIAPPVVIPAAPQVDGMVADSTTVTAKRPSSFDVKGNFIKATTIIPAASASAEPIDYCKGHVDPFKDQPVETFQPPAAAPFEKVNEWEDIVGDMVKSISKMTVGGSTLREKIRVEIRRLQSVRFNMFCMYVQ